MSSSQPIYTTPHNLRQVSGALGSCVLPFLVVSLILGILVPAPTSVAQTPEWVVSSLFTLESTVKDIRANLIIESGGVLQLLNSTLVMNLTKDAEFEILVKPGGRLIARNSTITNGPLGAHYWFRVRGAMELCDSNVRGTWGVFETGGIIISCNEVIITRCRLTDHKWYAITVNASSPEISDNTIEGCRAGIRVEGDGAPNISGNLIRNMEKEGIISLGARPHIRSNRLLNNWMGVGLFDSDAEVSGNEILGSGSSGIDCSSGSDAKISGNTISSGNGAGITIHSSSPLLSSNTISDNAVGVNCTSSRPIIRNNLITGSRGWGVYSVSGSPVLEGNLYTAGPGSENALGAVAVVWRLTIRVEDSERRPVGGADITIRDSLGAIVFRGRTERSGTFSGIELFQLHYDPNGTRHEDTPHTITVGAQGLSSSREVEVNEDQSITIRLGEVAPSFIPTGSGPLFALALIGALLNYVRKYRN